ncbi:uncharacterized protein METZ01_LOCUS411105, partial [marine metagenome]
MGTPSSNLTVGFQNRSVVIFPISAHVQSGSPGRFGT